MQSVAWCPLCRQMEKWRCAQSSSGGKKARDLCPLSLLVYLLLGVKLLSPVSAKRGHISSDTRVLLTRDWNRLGAIQRSCYPPSDEDTATSTKHYFFFQQDLKKTWTHISITLVLLFFSCRKALWVSMPRLEGVYEEACTAETTLVFIPDQLVLTLKSIAIIHGFNQGLDLAYFYESLYLSRLSDWKSRTFDAAFINRKLD